MAPLQTLKWPLTVSLPHATGKLKPLSTSRGHGHAWVSDMDTDLISERALFPDEGGEADACTTTADSFRATVIALRSLDGNKGVS
jgi:hypothetical protein